VAIHAGLCRRESGNGGSFHAAVAVTAIDPVISDMMFVAKLHRLLARNVLPGHVRRTRNREHSQKRQPDQKQSRKDTKSGDEVRAAMKNLRHVRLLHSGRERGQKGLCISRKTVPRIAGKCKPGAKLTA
jgi:hypothetical protein